MVGQVKGLVKQWGIGRSWKVWEIDCLEVARLHMLLDEEAEEGEVVNRARLRLLLRYGNLPATVRDNVWERQEKEHDIRERSLEPLAKKALKGTSAHLIVLPGW